MKENNCAGKNLKSVKEYAVVEDMNTKFRPYMEDKFVCIDQYGNQPKQGFFAVYDGHGGKEVSDYCADRLHIELLNSFKTLYDKSVEECIEASFLKVFFILVR